MYQKILNFIKYNNAFTIILGIFFFGFGITFAASEEVRDSVYASTETITSIDNSLIVSADLNNFNFNLRINSVTDDDKNYYAGYSYQTLAITNGVWQNQSVEKTLTVSKEALGGKDLGLYLAKELGENINYELSYLKRVQDLEKEKGQSQKVVTVEYSGLIGKLLDPKEEVIEGYNPVIPEIVPETPTVVESNPTEVIISIPYYEPSEKPVTEIASPEPTPLPTPEEMINEQLVQEVVEEILNEASSTPAIETIETPILESESTTTPEQ